jgi:hypothetical protein
MSAKDIEARIQLAGDSVERIAMLAARESEGILPRRVSITEIAGRINPVEMAQYAEREEAAAKIQAQFRAKTMHDEVLKRGEEMDFVSTGDLRKAAGVGDDDEEEGAGENAANWVSVTEMEIPDESRARVQQTARRSFLPTRDVQSSINERMEALSKNT